jgi:hypothetical protein
MTPDGPRYFVELLSQATYGAAGPPGLTGLKITVNVPRPSDAAAALRAIADRLDLNRMTLEG